MEHGKNSLVIVQVTDNVLKADASMIGNLTESSHSTENELTDEKTKAGRVLAYNEFNTESLEITCYGRKNDSGQTEIERALKEKKQLKCWKFDKNLNNNGKHDSIFFYGLVESIERTEPGDNFVEISATIQVLGESQKGELEPLPQSVLDLASYGFEKPGASTGDWGSENHEYAPDESVTAPTLQKGALTNTTAIINITGGESGDIYTIYKNDKKLVTTTSTSYKVTGLTKNTLYKFKAKITRKGKSSNLSTELQITTENN